MIFKIYLIILVICITEGIKIGLGNGRLSQEPSSLKSEVLKYKTSECGGSSSEEDNDRSRRKSKKKHKNKKDSDSDESNSEDEDSDEDDKTKKKRRKNHNRRNRKNGNRSVNFGLNSYEGTRYGMMDRRPPQDDYFNRRPGEMYNPWDQNQNQNQNRNPYQAGNPYQHRGQNSPYPMDDDYFPQRGDNRRNPTMGQNPYEYPPRGGNNNRGTQYSYGNRDYNNRGTRYNNRGDRDDRYNGNRNPYHQNNYDDDDYDDNDDDDSQNSSRDRHHKYGHRKRGNNRRNKGRGKNKNRRKHSNNDSEEECNSQCVFNNMEIMEDDGIPSESAMIKWAQEKIKNEKLKQAAVKEIRKCFGTMASSDGDNSCNFSKSLSSCLKLGLDDDNDNDDDDDDDDR